MLLPMMIRILRDSNYDVLATVMDQSAVNRKSYSLLGATVEKPFFFVDEIQVFALFDYPYLRKSMRTTFLECAMESSDGKVSGEIIKNAYLLDKKASTRLFPKLTVDHFFYDTFQKMRVGLATQVLSNSLAQGLKQMFDNGLLKGNKVVIINIIAFVKNSNTLFDLLNADNINDCNDNKRGISENNIEPLKMLSKYFSTLQKVSSGAVYWISGLQQTLRAYIMLFEKMHSQQNDFVLFTKYFTQDPIENLFGMIRARGGNNKNPYLIDFLRIVSQIMTSKLLIECKNTNCEFKQDSLVTILDLEKYSLPIENKPVNIFLIILIVLCCLV